VTPTVGGYVQLSPACHGRAPALRHGWANLQLPSMGASTTTQKTTKQHRCGREQGCIPLFWKGRGWEMEKSQHRQRDRTGDAPGVSPARQAGSVHGVRLGLAV